MEARPVLIRGLDKIIKIACGENHVVALRNNGDVYTWGGTEHGCLGRRVCPRRLFQYLRPMSVIKQKIADIYCGYHHSFAVQKDDTTIQTWGWNSHGQTGILPAQPNNPNEIVLNPQKTHILEGLRVKQIAGGKFTSAAILEETRRCCVWGRTDGGSLGTDINNIPPQHLLPHLLQDDNGRAIVLTKPAFMMKNEFFKQVALGPEHGLAVLNTGNVSSWGDSRFYQIGHNDDRPVQGDPLRVRCPTIIGEKIFWAGSGDEYGILATRYKAPTEGRDVSEYEGLWHGPMVAPRPSLSPTPSTSEDDSMQYVTPPHQRDVSPTPPRRSPQPPPPQPSRGTESERSTESEPIAIGSSPAGDTLPQPDVEPEITSPQRGIESEPIEISSSSPAGDISPQPDIKQEITLPQRGTESEPIEISSSSPAGEVSPQPYIKQEIPPPQRGTESEPIEISSSSPAGDVSPQPYIKQEFPPPQRGTESEPIEISSSSPAGDVSPQPYIKQEITPRQLLPELPPHIQPPHIQPPEPPHNTMEEPISISSSSASPNSPELPPHLHPPQPTHSTMEEPISISSPSASPNSPELPPYLQPPQQTHNTMEEPISISSSSASPNLSPGGDDSLFTIHFDQSGQTVRVSVEATADEIAETLYQAVNWTKSREGWWWKPNGGRNLDKIIDDERGWAELIAEGRSRRHVWGLAPNEWADSPTAVRNN